MSRYLELVRRSRQKGPLFTAKGLLVILATISMIASTVYWWGIQSQLTQDWLVAIAFTAIMVLAPPALVSFLIPWSPAGMLLQRINAQTWGHVVVFIAASFLIYYSFEIQWAWWSAQQVVYDARLVLQQVLIGIIGFIIVPALLWTPVSTDELVEQIRQAHLVRRYELQTQADIAILRATLLRAQEKALIGFANLTVQEREELAGVMRALVRGIDQTLQQIGESVEKVAGVTVPFESLEDNEQVQYYLDTVRRALTDTEVCALTKSSQTNYQQRKQ